LASLGNNGLPSLRREITLAKRLEFTHFLLHPGTAKGATEKSQGIDALAFCLNDMLKKEQDIEIVLENTCQGKLAVGSDIFDFKVLLEKIDMPERIGFCIDTAHAHSFGYNITDDESQDAFIALLDKTISLERIKLLHLNDVHDACGSRKDRHAVIGEGAIGSNALKRFALHPQLQTIPFVLELPDMSVEQEKIAIEAVYTWEKE
jgi:deoxyribonuclease-4